ncbi:MAG: secondary thiamine-phosphate synthase enzyme YjbQ [Syntrophales bacterium]|jgi:secondary thiamine-phosphate synthase enzyme|nr:secondary thiamine-phosphate synthase enzyme YjbQ [Syntrophales bacterium]NLN59537.1 YjbQ family protein [Deltaproteobacteria bacterium]
MLKQLSIKTTSRCQMVDITGQVRSVLRESGYRNGLCQVYVPHTTAGVTINENADPDVPRDILATLERLIPLHGDYRHREGNADAHVKASLMGSSQTVLFENGHLVLGTWQSLFFCEFDGPRARSLFVRLIQDL